MYTRNLLWLVSLVSAAPLYAADVPTNTPLAPQQVFRYNNHSDPGTLDPQKVEENTAAQIVLDLFEGLVWMDGEGQVQPAQAERWEILDGGKRYIFWICPYISRHLLSLNPLLACCRRYSRGER